MEATSATTTDAAAAAVATMAKDIVRLEKELAASKVCSFV